MSRNFEITIAVLVTIFSATGCSNLIIPTSTAIPTITPASENTNVCQGPIQASAPIVVRQDGVGGTDNTESGRFATSSKAASTSAGILVSWKTGINGQVPVPNSYVRLLDENAQPIGDISLPFERSVVQTPNFISKDDGALLTFCGIYNHDGTHLTSTLLDPYGKLISEQRRFLSSEFDCAYPESDAIWTGSHILFAWSSHAYGQNGEDTNLILDVADVNGKSLTEKILRPDAMLDPQFAFGHGNILLVVPTRTGADFLTDNNRGQTHLAIHRFNTEGAELGNPVILEPKEGLGFEFGSSFIVPTRHGWLLLASTFLRSSNYYVAHLSPDGALVSGPELMNAGTDIVFLDVVPYGGGAMALTDWQDSFEISNIFFLSDDGKIKHAWHPENNETLLLGGLVVHKGRLFFTYTGGSHGNPVTNEVLIRELQCGP